MSIEWFRDLAIVILGLGVTIVVISLGILAWLLYRKLKPILDSVKATTKTVEKFSATVEEEIYQQPCGRGVHAVFRLRPPGHLFAGRLR